MFIYFHSLIFFCRLQMNVCFSLILWQILMEIKADYCGENKIPYGLEVHRNGQPILLCSRPNCFEKKYAVSWNSLKSTWKKLSRWNISRLEKFKRLINYPSLFFFSKRKQIQLQPNKIFLSSLVWKYSPEMITLSARK